MEIRTSSSIDLMKETNSPGFERWSVGNRGDIEKERQDSPPKPTKKKTH